MVTYNIRKICYTKIARYYNNVAKKYKHTYSRALMHKSEEVDYTLEELERGSVIAEDFLNKQRGKNYKKDMNPRIHRTVIASSKYIIL